MNEKQKREDDYETEYIVLWDDVRNNGYIIKRSDVDRDAEERPHSVVGRYRGRKGYNMKIKKQTYRCRALMPGTHGETRRKK